MAGSSRNAFAVVKEGPDRRQYYVRERVTYRSDVMWGNLYRRFRVNCTALVVGTA